jgi:hypothetical protein
MCDVHFYTYLRNKIFKKVNLLIAKCHIKYTSDKRTYF